MSVFVGIWYIASYSFSSKCGANLSLHGVFKLSLWILACQTSLRLFQALKKHLPDGMIESEAQKTLLQETKARQPRQQQKINGKLATNDNFRVILLMFFCDSIKHPRNKKGVQKSCLQVQRLLDDYVIHFFEMFSSK